MPSISLTPMRAYLASSIAGQLNDNKVRGLLAEVAFRTELERLGFGTRVSPGGWIVRSKGAGIFGHHTAVFFPELIRPDTEYAAGRTPAPTQALHTICATFHQLGIKSYFCAAEVARSDDPTTITWKAMQLGIPDPQGYQPFPGCLTGFSARGRAYSWLRYHTDVSRIPDSAVPEEFSKEHVRVTFANRFTAEISDVDGILWGENRTYPVEIKEKTPAPSDDLGDFFGLDVGPFVKLAFYAAKHGQMHSLFVVHEVDASPERRHVEWWYVTFDHLAQFASWNQRGGGRAMGGGMSSVVRIPKAEFRALTRSELDAL